MPIWTVRHEWPRRCPIPMASAELDEEQSTRIRVALRCRPFNQRELNEGGAAESAICCTDNAVIAGVAGRDAKTFGYDHVFGSGDTQETVFEGVGRQLLENALSAYNGCIFAYGQTGSGKTHSMVGDVNSATERGILPRACARLFEMITEKRKSDATFQATVLASYLEIYNEKLFDLLVGGSLEARTELPVRLHPDLGPIVPNLTECPMDSEHEALELFDFGTKRRAVGATQMNAQSSRSHAVFTIQIRMLVISASGVVESQSRVHFVDLAGSEKQKKSGATGSRLKEGININQSLSTLGRVISDLTKPGGRSLPPFRDSKLTMLLKDALMGNSRTELLACCSPARMNLDETISTLEFAARCKLVKTSAKKNEEARGDIIARLTAEKESIESMLLRERTASETLCRQLQEELEKALEKARAAEQKNGSAGGLLGVDVSDNASPDEPTLPALDTKVSASFRGQKLSGVVRHGGSVAFGPQGLVVGVELDEAHAAACDGSVQGTRYFTCAPGRGVFVRPDACASLEFKSANAALRSLFALRPKAAEPEEPRSADQLEQGDMSPSPDCVASPEASPDASPGASPRDEVAMQEELRARLEAEQEAQKARENDLASQLEALKTTQESWQLNQKDIETRRAEQQRHREAELSKLGMHLAGVAIDDMPNAPRLVNLHPDPALKGCLVYYLPVGESSIGADGERCRIKLVGLSVAAEVCVVINEGNETLTLRPSPNALVRVNGSVTQSDSVRQLCDGDRLAIGRAYIFRVEIPNSSAVGPGQPSAEESADFESAMVEIAACAQVDPEWENGVQKAMLLVKTDFGAEAAATLLAAARRASEAIATANVVLQEMPLAWRDGVARYGLSVLFNAQGLPEVCITAQRSETSGSDGRNVGPSSGIWELDRFVSDKMPAMQEALLLANVSEDPGLRHWESRAWSEVSVEDYKALAAELALSEARRSAAEGRLLKRGLSIDGPEEDSATGRGWLQNVRLGFSRVARHAAAKERAPALGSGGAAKSFMRSVSPSAIVRSMSSGRLDRPRPGTDPRSPGPFAFNASLSLGPPADARHSLPPTFSPPASRRSSGGASATL